MEIDLSEINQFGARMRALPEAVSVNVLEEAVDAACDPIIREARQRARHRTGKLANSIRSKTLERNRDIVSKQVAPHVPYAYLIEYGHALVRGGSLKRGGHVVGSVPAFPFMRPAFDHGLPLAADRMLGVIGPELERAFTQKGP